MEEPGNYLNCDDILNNKVQNYSSINLYASEKNM